MLTNLLVREPKSENCLDLIFAAPPFKKVIICTRYKLYHICNQKIYVGYVKQCGSNWVKIKGAQLKIDLHSPIAH